jgi:curved DNA-binding protein CbpA
MPCIGMSERFFWEMFDLPPGSARREIRRAYHRLARESHPDLYPEDQKPFQELKMIALNEAYRYLMEWGGRGETIPEPEAHGEERSPERNSAHEEASSVEVGFHHEPAYAYYKQGFIHYSRALHGIEALYQSIARYHRIHFNPRDDAYDRFAGSLTELRQAHSYFSRVADEHGASIWAHDARAKLGRIERFSDLYRRILRNLKDSSLAP